MIIRIGSRIRRAAVVAIQRGMHAGAACGRLLTGTLTTMLRFEHDALDAIQEAIVALANNLPNIRDTSPRSLDAWLKRTAVNKALSSRRKTRRFLPSGSSADLDGAWKQLATHLPPEDQAAAREALRFISRLPVKQRTAYLLRHYLDFTVASIAKEMRCSEGNVGHGMTSKPEEQHRMPKPVADLMRAMERGGSTSTPRPHYSTRSNTSCLPQSARHRPALRVLDPAVVGYLSSSSARVSEQVRTYLYWPWAKSRYGH